MKPSRPSRSVLVLTGLLATAIATPRAGAALPVAAPLPDPTLAMLPVPVLANAGTEEVVEQYGAVQALFIDMMVELSKQLPSGTKNPRENMYAGLAAIWMAGAVGGAFNVGAGTALGTTIGALADGVGAPVGAAVGLFGGLALTQAELVTLGVGTMAAVEYIEKTYPYEKFGAVSPDLQGDDAPGSVLAQRQSSTHAGAWGGAFMLDAAAHAGPYESMFIHLVTASFNPGFEKIVDDLAKTSKGPLALFKPAAQRLAYIHDNQRIGAGTKTAEPLDGWVQTASLVLRADQQTIEDLWLRALGLGSMSAKVKDGKLVVVPPALLRDLGAPETVSKSIGTMSVRVDAPAPLVASLRATLSPGPFSITLGDPKLVKTGADKGKVKIALSIEKGSVLASGRLQVRINDDVHEIGGDFSPKLDRDFAATAYFRFQSGVLVFDRIDVGTLSLKPGLPALPGPLEAVVGGLVAKVEGEAEKAARALFGDDGIKAAFDAASAKSTRALAKELEASARAKGLASIAGIGKVEVTDGKLAVTVTGNRLDAPSTPTTAQVAAAFADATVRANPMLKPLKGITVGK